VSVGDTPPSFGGAPVLLLESRLAAETAAMVRRLGGVPFSAPAVVEAALDADIDVREFIDRLHEGRDHLVVFLTGAAVARIYSIAERLQLAVSLTLGLNRATVVARGPKPGGALARRGLNIVAVPSPFTTADVLATVDGLPVERRDVTVVHYGERNEAIVASLSGRGANVRDLVVYEWQLPADTAPLRSAVDSIIAGDIPIVAFTSQIQIRHLLAVAEQRRDSLVSALNTSVIVGAVGPTCAAACHECDIVQVIVPEQPKLAPLLVAIATAAARRHADAPTHHE
jgi:uroporphyrinogen-III synthase